MHEKGRLTTAHQLSGMRHFGIVNIYPFAWHIVPIILELFVLIYIRPRWYWSAGEQNWTWETPFFNLHVILLFVIFRFHC